MHASTKRVLTAILYVCIIAGAIVRGHYLMGPAPGVVFGILAGSALFLIYRAFTTGGRFRRLRHIVASVIAGVVLALVARPTWFNNDFNALIEDRQVERATQSQLIRIFSGDLRFANLAFRCGFTKCIVVHVDGSVKNERDLFDLRRQIFDTCPHVSSRWLFYDVATAQKAGKTYRGCDLELFGDPRAK